MVSINLQGSTVCVKVLGLHKLLALKSQTQFSVNNILNVKIAERQLRPPLVRFPGTSIPGLIAAGTYLGNGKKEFWDRVFKNEAIEIELQNEKFTKIVVDVENPESIIKLLSKQ
jgi:hypothetical protein